MDKEGILKWPTWAWYKNFKPWTYLFDAVKKRLLPPMSLSNVSFGIKCFFAFDLTHEHSVKYPPTSITKFWTCKTTWAALYSKHKQHYSWFKQIKKNTFKRIWKYYSWNLKCFFFFGKVLESKVVALSGQIIYGTPFFLFSCPLYASLKKL